MKSRKKCTHRTGGVVPKSQMDRSETENSNVAASKNPDASNHKRETSSCNRARERQRFLCGRLSTDATSPSKFIVFACCSIYNDIAKSSREHDQWRLSMRLSSFPVVVLRWENFRAVLPI